MQFDRPRASGKPASRAAGQLVVPEKFREELARIRAQGYAIIDEELELGIRSIAVPIGTSFGRVVAAMNASTSIARHSVEDLQTIFLPELLRTAEELSRSMDW